MVLSKEPTDDQVLQWDAFKGASKCKVPTVQFAVFHKCVTVHYTSAPLRPLWSSPGVSSWTTEQKGCHSNCLQGSSPLHPRGCCWLTTDGLKVGSEWQIHSKGFAPQMAVSCLLGWPHRDSYSHVMHFPGSLRHMSKYGCIHSEAHMWLTVHSPHTTLVTLHVAVHDVRLCSVGDPVVARWGWRVAVKDGMTRGSRSVSRPPWTHCYWWVGVCSNSSWATNLTKSWDPSRSNPAEGPGRPTASSLPSLPSLLLAPLGPERPSLPSIPDAPGAPMGPLRPSLPSLPGGPGGPWGPHWQGQLSSLIVASLAC